MLLGTQRINERGHLEIGGCDAVELAREFGTPLYVLDEDCLRENCRAYLTAFTKRCPGCVVSYSLKALVTLAVCRIVEEEGLAADADSAGELYTALTAGFPPSRIITHGNNKSRREMEMAVEHGIHRLVVDCVEEIGRLEQVAAERDAVLNVLLRVTPGVAADTHHHIQTGKIDTKFGLSITGGAALEGARRIFAAPHLRLRGLHCHIGSQILSVEPFARACEVMMQIAAAVTDIGVRLEFIDLGGGLGIPYHRGEGETGPTPADYAQAVVPVFRKGIAAAGISPELWVEPGRSLVADSTILLSGVNSVKPAHRNFVNVDAGFNLLIRPAMYDAWHEIIAANKAGLPATVLSTIAGPICETGDILARDRMLPELTAGDVIAVLDTGAYGFAMSSQYNSRPRCAEVLLSRSRVALMRRSEELKDVMATMQDPPWQGPP
jgi:diaminopimelate decarboxylase